MNAKTVLIAVILALLVGACAFRPGDGGDYPRCMGLNCGPTPQVIDQPGRVTAVEGGHGSVTVVPAEPRPTPEYRGKLVISWCTGGHCKPSIKPR